MIFKTTPPILPTPPSYEKNLKPPFFKNFENSTPSPFIKGGGNYVMSETSQIMMHIDNPGIVRKVDSGIFRNIQGDSAIFSHVQA